MAKSVDLLKEAMASEETSIKKYQEALTAMVHDESKKMVEGVIRSKKEHIVSVQKILEQSSKCPAIKQ